MKYFVLVLISSVLGLWGSSVSVNESNATINIDKEKLLLQLEEHLVSSRLTQGIQMLGQESSRSEPKRSKDVLALEQLLNSPQQDAMGVNIQYYPLT